MTDWIVEAAKLFPLVGVTIDVSLNITWQCFTNQVRYDHLSENYRNQFREVHSRVPCRGVTSTSAVCLIFLPTVHV